MRVKNIYQCDISCTNCTYENKNPSGTGFIDECVTDTCPNNHFKLGTVDKLGGRHVEGYGWNPLGEFCNLCKHENCEDCIKWSNRDKKLKNATPTELKQKEEKKPVIVPQQNKEKVVAEQPVAEEVKETVKQKNSPEVVQNVQNEDENEDIKTLKEHTFVERDNIKDVPFDILADIRKLQEQDKANNTSEDDELFEDEDDEENVDFGLEMSETEDEDDYGQDQFDNDDEDDIPKPIGYEDYADADDDDDDDFEEDDDAEFKMFVPTKFLKSPMLSPKGQQIAKYQVREYGILLVVCGDANVTVKGRNDSDGFSYRDSAKFPRYIKEKIMDESIYTDPNIKVTNNMYFNFVHFKEIDGDLVESGDKRCDIDISNASETKVHKIMKEVFDSFKK